MERDEPKAFLRFYRKLVGLLDEHEKARVIVHEATASVYEALRRPADPLPPEKATAYFLEVVGSMGLKLRLAKNGDVFLRCNPEFVPEIDLRVHHVNGKPAMHDQLKEKSAMDDPWLRIEARLTVEAAMNGLAERDRAIVLQCRAVDPECGLTLKVLGEQDGGIGSQEMGKRLKRIFSVLRSISA